jgi:peptidoglycan/LPS O-acetylase OafA/YrhL
VAPGRSPVKAVLALPPLVWLGRISYGLYLWNFPARVAITRSSTGLSGTAVTALRLLFTLAFATLSFYLVEQPIRRGKLTARVTRCATPIAMTGVATALVLATTVPD